MPESKVSIYCLKYADTVLRESMIFEGGAADIQLPITFSIYLIKCGNRNILVDAGCTTMPGFIMQSFNSPVFVLSQLGLCADDITDVIITHAHHDHIEAVKYFKNAIVHISKVGYERGKKYIPDNFRVSIFEDEYNITPEIKIIEWGGHARGSSIVEIKTEDIIHIMAGDECYTNANIERKICTGSYYNKEKASQFISKFSDKKYCVHTCHDISLKTERIM